MARIKIFGDSILKGTLYNPTSGRYEFDNYLRTLPDSENLSKFGLTITKGSDYVRRSLDKDSECEYVLLDLGGNDADFYWREISDAPEERHLPKTPIEIFATTYVDLIKYIRSKKITPVVTTLALLDSDFYFEYFCRVQGCVPENVMQWLGYKNHIAEFQNRYSEVVKQIADQEKIPLIDIRAALLESSGCSSFEDTLNDRRGCERKITDLLCEDGIHVNKNGQDVISSCIKSFFMIH